MAFNLDPSQIGDLFSGGGNGYGAVPQSTEKITNLSPHVDGGSTSSSVGARATAPSDRRVLHVAAGIVLVSLALLWLMGGVLFRSASL